MGKHFYLFTITFSLILLICTPATSSASALEDELKELISEYRVAGDNPREVLRPLKWSGITDTRLFDIVESDLLEHMDAIGSVWAEGNSWRVQSLAYSGQEKYRETIKKVIVSGRSSKLKRHAKSSLQVIDDFAGYNVIISANLEDVNRKRLESQRIINMISSNDFELIRAGASRIYHHHPKDAELISLSANRVEQLYLTAIKRFPDADAVGWLCKVIGKTKDKQYEALLAKVSKKSPSKDLRRYARTALITLQGKKKHGPDRLM